MWPGDIFRYSLLKDPLPESGIYEITYTVSGLKPEKGRAPRIKVYEAKLDRTLARAGRRRAGRSADHGHLPRASAERPAEHRRL